MTTRNSSGSILGIGEDFMRLLKVVSLVVAATVFVLKIDANTRAQAETLRSIKAMLESHEGRLVSLETTKIRRESYELGVEDGLKDALGRSTRVGGH